MSRKKTRYSTELKTKLVLEVLKWDSVLYPKSQDNLIFPNIIWEREKK